MALAAKHCPASFLIFPSSPQRRNANSNPRPRCLLRLSPPPLLSPPSRACIFSCRAHGLAQQSTQTRTLRDLCHGRVPERILTRAEEVGYVTPTDVQEQSLPILLSGQDCVLHAQVMLM